MELRAVVADRLRAGASRESVYAELNRLRDELRAAGKANEADVVADVMAKARHKRSARRGSER